MSLPTVAVTLTAYDQNGHPVSGARVLAQLNKTEVFSGFVVPERVSALTDALGVATLNLFPNELGASGSLYRVQAWNPDTGARFLDATAAVPNSSCRLEQILVQEPYPPIDAAQQALQAAQAALAPVTTQAQAAAASANASAASAAAALNSQVAAADSAASAAYDAARIDLGALDTAVATSAANALAAKVANTTAQTAAVTATTQAGIATTKAAEADADAATASTMATQAAASATAADASEAASLAQAGLAQTAKTAAEAARDTAAASATTATTQATAATDANTAAQAASVMALGAATTATTQATAAAGSATAAQTAQVAAEAARDEAEIFAGMAAGGVLSGTYPNPGFAVDMATQAELDGHTGNTANPHIVTKAQVGLGNVDNTSDENKPVSTAAQAALDLKAALSGAVFTGAVSVPAGASGSQVPQAQEIPSLIGMTSAVLFFPLTSAPVGWLKANGAAVSRTAYADLFSKIGTTFGAGNGTTTFNVPDLRGEFIRGWDDGRGADSGRVFGTAQLDAVQGHHHAISNANDSLYRLLYIGTTGGVGSSGNNYTTSGVVGVLTATTMATNGVNGTPRVASETRSRNIALLACIKY